MASRMPLADVVNKRREAWRFKDSSEMTAVSLVDENDEAGVCLATLVEPGADQQATPMPAGTTEP